MITVRTTMHLQTDARELVPVPVECSYRGTDPYAVRFSYDDDCGTVHQEFARDLLAAGLVCGSGDGG
ncbi:SsgA family sporulation/cell division regulator [Kitasatospora sp. NPDC059327]|uniref:SsgA family sporulation/cell division regulator n=1 Tax=Kitasatospora sp. NPDC059327 TaxID=3346803 RepID=UPI00367CE98C